MQFSDAVVGEFEMRKEDPCRISTANNEPGSSVKHSDRVNDTAGANNNPNVNAKVGANIVCGGGTVAANSVTTTGPSANAQPHNNVNEPLRQRSQTADMNRSSLSNAPNVDLLHATKRQIDSPNRRKLLSQSWRGKCLFVTSWLALLLAARVDWNTFRTRVAWLLTPAVRMNYPLTDLISWLEDIQNEINNNEWIAFDEGSPIDRIEKVRALVGNYKLCALYSSNLIDTLLRYHAEELDDKSKLFLREMRVSIGDFMRNSELIFPAQQKSVWNFHFWKCLDQMADGLVNGSAEQLIGGAEFSGVEYFLRNIPVRRLGSDVKRLRIRYNLLSDIGHNIQNISDVYFNTTELHFVPNPHHFVDTLAIISRIIESNPKLAPVINNGSQYWVKTRRLMKAAIPGLNRMVPLLHRNLRCVDKILNSAPFVAEQYRRIRREFNTQPRGVILSVNQSDCKRLQLLIRQIQFEIDWQFKHYEGYYGDIHYVTPDFSGQRFSIA